MSIIVDRGWCRAAQAARHQLEVAGVRDAASQGLVLSGVIPLCWSLTGS